MAEETAGIGEAGALVNRATAPQDMAITKGIIQSQNNALRKAQMEAKKVAAIDAIKEKQGKYLSQVGIGKYKNQSVLNKVKEKAKETSAKIYDAGDNQQLIYQAINDYEGYERDASILDNYLEDFNYKKGFVRLEGAKEALENNKTEDWINKQHELVKPLIKDENGMLENPQIEELQLGTEFEKAARLIPRTLLEQKEIGNSKSKFVMQADDAAVRVTADDFLENQRYLRYLPFDKDFQKYYNDNKGTYEALPKLMTDFTFEKVRAAARKQDQIQSIYSQQAAQQKALGSVDIETTKKIKLGLTDNNYKLGEPDESGWRYINTYATPDNTFLEKTENGSNKIKPVKIRRIDDNTFEIEGEIGARLNPIKTTKNPKTGLSVREGDPYTIKVSEDAAASKYGLTPPYLNAYYPKSKKATGATGAKGQPKLSVAEQMRLAAKNKKR